MFLWNFWTSVVQQTFLCIPTVLQALSISYFQWGRQTNMWPLQYGKCNRVDLPEVQEETRGEVSFHHLLGELWKAPQNGNGVGIWTWLRAGYEEGVGSSSQVKEQQNHGDARVCWAGQPWLGKGLTAGRGKVTGSEARQVRRLWRVVFHVMPRSLNFIPYKRDILLKSFKLRHNMIRFAFKKKNLDSSEEKEKYWWWWWYLFFIELPVCHFTSINSCNFCSNSGG